jgi:hypothetical protein
MLVGRVPEILGRQMNIDLGDVSRQGREVRQGGMGVGDLI